jgi:hypothetical protein
MILPSDRAFIHIIEIPRLLLVYHNSAGYTSAAADPAFASSAAAGFGYF